MSGVLPLLDGVESYPCVGVVVAAVKSLVLGRDVCASAHLRGEVVRLSDVQYAAGLVFQPHRIRQLDARQSYISSFRGVPFATRRGQFS
jgi:hypothetical protein